MDAHSLCKWCCTKYFKNVIKLKSLGSNIELCGFLFTNNSTPYEQHILTHMAVILKESNCDLQYKIAVLNPYIISFALIHVL